MALQEYAKLPVFMAQQALTQMTSVSVSWESNRQQVDLLNEGLGGFTEGSGVCTIEIGYAVPISGPERDFIADCVDGSFVDMQIGIGSKDYVGRGKVNTTAISQSVNAPVEGTLTWVGEFKKRR